MTVPSRIRTIPTRPLPADTKVTNAHSAKSPLFVNSIQKGFAVLHCFGSDRHSLGLAEICEATDFDKSTAQRFTHTLHALGYLAKDEATRKYSLSPKLLEFGLTYLESDHLVRIATPLLQAANRECNETVNLTRLVGTEVVYVARIVGRHVLSVDILLGSRFPAYLTAPGRAMLSCLPNDTVSAVLNASVLAKRTDHTVTSKSALMAEIRTARKKGYSIAIEQIYEGEISAAVPLTGLIDSQPAAVNVSVPLSRWTESAVKKKLVPILFMLANSIRSSTVRRP